MSKKKLSPQNITTIIVTITTVIGSIVGGYFVYRGTVKSKELEISAAQTEKAFQVAQTEIALQATQTEIANQAAQPNIQTPSSTQTTALVDNGTSQQSLESTNTPFVSDTSTPISSATNTPFPERVLFQDDFSNNKNGWRVGERSLDFSKQYLELINEQYQFKADFIRNTFTWINIPDLSAGDFYLTVETEVAQYTTNSDMGIAIMFRYGNHGQDTYAVVFKNDSTFEFHVKNNGNWKNLDAGSSTAFELQKGSSNIFGLKVFGQEFTAYANGQEVYIQKDDTLRGAGEIGLGVYGEATKSVIIRFDNLLVTENLNP